MGVLYILGRFLFFIAVGAMWYELRLRRLRHERQGKNFSRKRFVEAFPQLGIPEDIPATVYDYYGSQRPLKDFPFSPHDTYSEILHDDLADIDNDAAILLDRLGLIIVPGYIRELYGDKPIETLGELVLWLDLSRWSTYRQLVHGAVYSPHRWNYYLTCSSCCSLESGFSWPREG
jgi:hypothetical protein